MICDDCRQHIAMLSTTAFTGEGVRHIHRCRTCQSNWRVDHPDSEAHVEPIDSGVLFANLLVAFYDGNLNPTMTGEAVALARAYTRAFRDAQPTLRRVQMLRGEMPRA